MAQHRDWREEKLITKSGAELHRLPDPCDKGWRTEAIRGEHTLEGSVDACVETTETRNHPMVKEGIDLRRVSMLFAVQPRGNGVSIEPLTKRPYSYFHYGYDTIFCTIAILIFPMAIFLWLC